MFRARAHGALLAAGLLAAGASCFRLLPPPWPTAGAPAAGAPAAMAAVAGVAAGSPARKGPASAPLGQPLADAGALDGFPDWSPDGRRLAFMRDGAIWVMAADGQGARAVTGNPEAWDVGPVWSPDGARIAFIRYVDQARARDSRSALLLVRPDGGGEREILTAPGLLGYVAWHPRGHALAYTTDRQLVLYDLQRGRGQVLADAGDGAGLLPGGLAWSPDGQSLVYGAGPRQRAAGRPDLDLYRIPAGGGTPERLTSTGGQLPHFAPDGTRLAFRQPGQPGGIMALELATGRITPVAPDSGRYLYFHPRWAPDGKSLAASRLYLGRRPTGELHLSAAIVVLR